MCVCGGVRLMIGLIKLMNFNVFYIYIDKLCISLRAENLQPFIDNRVHILFTGSIL